MAKILNGKHKDKVVRIVQYCNDWIHVEHPDIPNQEAIFTPTRLDYTDEERNELIDAYNNDELGIMPDLYDWIDDDNLNRLVKKKDSLKFTWN